MVDGSEEAIVSAADTRRDTITALYPLDILSKQRTGAHPGKRFTPGAKVDFDMPLFFAAEDVGFGDVFEMHRVLCDIAEAGQAFVVRAQRAHKGVFIRRTRKGNCPAGLRGAKVCAFPIDYDKWPNVMRLDPRTDPVATWCWMLGLLGAEFADVTVSAHWSSSCCARTPAGEAPATLDARFWLMLDTAVGEQGCRDLLNLLNRRVRAYFEGCGIEMAKRHKPVDPKLADAQQPIYLATPIFEGLADPLTVRRALLEGSRDVVRTADLWAAMPKMASPDRFSVHETKSAPPKAKRARDPLG